MTEDEYRAAVATGEPFVCGGVEYEFLPLLPDPDETDQDDA